MPTVRRLERLPANFDRFIDEAASGISQVYGKPAEEEYRSTARSRVSGTLAHPNVLALGTMEGDEALAILMGIEHDAVAQIFFLHVLDDYSAASPDTELITETVRTYRAGGVDGIVCESVIFNPAGPLAAFEALDFKATERSIMRSPLDRLKFDARDCGETLLALSLDDVQAIGDCLAIAYRSDPGAELHREMRAAGSASAFAANVMGGGFGRFEPGYAVGIGDNEKLDAVLLACEPVARTGFIVQVATRPECRGRGYASALLSRAADRFRAHGLEQFALGVTDSNPAVELYRRIGLQSVCPVYAYSWWRP